MVSEFIWSLIILAASSRYKQYLLSTSVDWPSEEVKFSDKSDKNSKRQKFSSVIHSSYRTFDQYELQ